MDRVDVWDKFVSLSGGMQPQGKNPYKSKHIHMKTLAVTLVLAILTGSGLWAQSNDTITTASGLKYIIVKKGNGAPAEPGKEIGIHGIGTFTNGEIFWETRTTNFPFYYVADANQVIKGCEEGVQLMHVGDRYIFIMPPELAYGSRKRDPIPPNSTLIFDYELVSVEDPKPPVADTLYQAMNASGLKYTKELYHKLKETSFNAYNFREDQLVDLAYKLRKDKKYKEALAFLEMNLALFPQSAYTFYGYGDVYNDMGDNTKALDYFEKSLTLDPHNKSLQMKIEELSKDME